jgi:ArsR family metal-binding transcriptional regulator
MFLETIKIIETMPCLADKELFKATARASADLTEILPYLNSILEKPKYKPSSNSLVFKKGSSQMTVKDDIIALTKFTNLTQAYELLDWLKDLINDAYESKDEIEPNYEATKQIGLLLVYGLLPKTNCQKCGEPSCMAFAGKLSKLDAEIDDCPLFAEPEYKELKNKLINAFA